MLEKLKNSVLIGISTVSVAWVGKTFRFPIENWHIWLIGGIGCAAVVWMWWDEEREDNLQQVFERRGVCVSEGDKKLYPTLRHGAESN